LQQQDPFRVQQLVGWAIFLRSGTNAAAFQAKKIPRSNAPTARVSPAARIAFLQPIAE
jgi:hypothetical protein